MLVETVVIAGDRAGADIGPGTHRRIAQIGKMVHLGGLPEVAVLHLDEIADFRFAAKRASPKPREGLTLAPEAMAAPSR